MSFPFHIRDLSNGDKNLPRSLRRTKYSGGKDKGSCTLRKTNHSRKTTPFRICYFTMHCLDMNRS
jgi:hypothetical protein